jgi:hypothetical protein
MAPRRDKDFYRDLKRCIKKAGNKKRRTFFKKNLLENPEEAHLFTEDDFEFGDYSSQQFNGMDNDSTRRREGDSSPHDDGLIDDYPDEHDRY